jgi:hypothetical protein
MNCQKILSIDKNEYLIKSVQKPLGKMLLIVLFVWLLHLNNYLWQPFIIAFTAISFMPQWRHFWLFIAAMAFLIMGVYFDQWGDWQALINASNHQKLPHPGDNELRFVGVASTFIFSEIFIYLTFKYQQIRIMQYPIFNLLIIIFMLLAVASYVPATFTNKAYLWSFIIVFCHYFWYIGYTILDCKSYQGRDIIFEYSRYYPLWGGTNTPFPKGPTYLRKIEAKNPEEFAVTQLKALKLICWALILNFCCGFFLDAMNYYHFLTIPGVIHAYSLHQHLSWQTAWLFLVANFIYTLLNLCVYGHIFIAMCRMCGFRALRNTYKPLEATTIAEFWNRYYYYFKELLVAFFFYPTYFRFFKTMPRVRLFVATLAAATLGVILYHFLSNLTYIMDHGLLNSLWALHVYMIYATMLGLAIGISQLRNANKPVIPLRWHKRIQASVTTVGFFLFLSIFDSPYNSMDITLNIKFLLNLFNIMW